MHRRPSPHPTATLLTSLALLTGVLLVAGCSGSKPSVPAGAGQLEAAATLTKGNESVPASSALHGMSALEVWAKTKADADATTSVHVTARYLDGEQLNLKMTDQDKVFGILTLRSDRIVVRRLGRTLYVKATSRFWARRGQAARATELAGRWVRVKPGTAPGLGRLFELTDMDYVVSDVMSLSTEGQQALKLVPGGTIGGRPTVGLTDPTGTDDTAGQTLYVLAGDPALPMNFAMSADHRQFMTFRGWNEDFTVVAPKGAIDLARAR